ncbi:PC4 domain-containing protein [Nephila pilipes]|uniref:PC4 domain-containing protein n=2 Tax=Nephila pilipes TaxID=299642 RepID=A0A8X6IHR8_NEPPI|nr:PC4 domain-containing protein [Nephila pilipes]GFS84049.1 PC4 domain-containing protein [Nephila pilipes]
MKRVAPLASTNASVKKVCFFKDSKKDSSFKPDAVPENHFHLGRSNYAIVSDFADVARIHLRQYKLDATGSLFPTKSGITLIPSEWLALVREFAAIDQAFQDGKNCNKPIHRVVGTYTSVRTVIALGLTTEESNESPPINF